MLVSSTLPTVLLIPDYNWQKQKQNKKGREIPIGWKNAQQNTCTATVKTLLLVQPLCVKNTVKQWQRFELPIAQSTQRQITSGVFVVDIHLSVGELCTSHCRDFFPATAKNKAL